MPLKSTSVPRSPSSPSSPYPSSTARRTSSQPKSSRQQFSACGACRMRRWGSSFAAVPRWPRRAQLTGGIEFAAISKTCLFRAQAHSHSAPTAKNAVSNACLCSPIFPFGVSLDIARSDEFAEVKAVKLLRRGRRLQQVEYVPSRLFTPLLFGSRVCIQSRLWQIY
jgi:hypothetical protein